VFYPFQELLTGHAEYRTKMTVSHRTDYRTNLTDVTKHPANTVDIFEIDQEISSAATDLDDFVT
jgi:hypothetical protein